MKGVIIALAIVATAAALGACRKEVASAPLKGFVPAITVTQ